MWIVTIRDTQQTVWDVQIRLTASDSTATWAQTDPVIWSQAERARAQIRWDGQLIWQGIVTGRDADGRTYRYQATGWGIYLRSRYLRAGLSGAAKGVATAIASPFHWLPPIAERGDDWQLLPADVDAGITPADALDRLCQQTGCIWWVTGDGQIVISSRSGDASRTIRLHDHCQSVYQMRYQDSTPAITRATMIGYQGLTQETGYPADLTTITRHAFAAGCQAQHWPLLPTTNRLGGAQIDAIASGCLLVRIAGTGVYGYSGDGGPAISAQIGPILAVCHDPNGHIYIATNDRIRRIDAVTSIITTVAGTGTPGSWAGLPAPATTVDIGYVTSLVTDADGHLYIADAVTSSIYRLDAVTGILSRWAGTGALGGYDGSSGDPLTIPLGLIQQMVWVGADAYILTRSTTVDSHSYVIRISAGVLSLYAGGGLTLGDGGPATAANLRTAYGIAYAAGYLYVAQYADDEPSFATGRIRRIDLSTDIITTIAGGGYSFIADTNGSGTDMAVGASWRMYAAGGHLWWREADFGVNSLRFLASPIGTDQIYAVTPARVIAGELNADGPLIERTITRTYAVSDYGILAEGDATLRQAQCFARSDRWARACHSMAASGDLSPDATRALARLNVYALSSAPPAAPALSGIASRTIDFSSRSPSSRLWLWVRLIFVDIPLFSTAGADLSFTVRVGGTTYYTLTRSVAPGYSESIPDTLVDVTAIPRSAQLVEIALSGAATGDLTSYIWQIQVDSVVFLEE